MSEPILSINNLSKTFNKSFKAVNNLTLQVEEGEVYGFLGPNGAGKTTTIRMILGLMKPDRGEVFIGGHSVQKSRYKALNSIGALVEGPAFYNHMSALDNLKIFAEYSGGVDRDRIYEVLRFVGLDKRGKDKVGSFSLGMKQRLGIGQALLNRPKLLVLDEPTNGLDPYGMKDIRELLRSLALKEKTTVFLSSHILSEIQEICSKVAIINRGEVVVADRVERLLNPDNKVYVVESSDIKALERAVTKSPNIKLLSDRPFKIEIVERPGRVLKELVDSGLDISAFYPFRPKLEDFFFDITGNCYSKG